MAGPEQQMANLVCGDGTEEKRQVRAWQHEGGCLIGDPVIKNISEPGATSTDRAWPGNAQGVRTARRRLDIPRGRTRSANSVGLRICKHSGSLKTSEVDGEQSTHVISTPACEKIWSTSFSNCRIILDGTWA